MPDLAALSEGETALRAVERDWNAAAQDWDSTGLVALYTEDALAVQPGGSANPAAALALPIFNGRRRVAQSAAAQAASL